MNTITENTNLFNNYTNYIYEVQEYETVIDNPSCKYILFNPSIHYWMALDDIGLTIYKEINANNNIGIVKQNLINKFSINESIFKEDVLPFIITLLENNFLSYNESLKEAAWMSKPVNIEEISKYPFCDIYISLTDKCNLNCIYCYNKKIRTNRINNEYSTKISSDSIIKLLTEFRSLGGQRVVFTGGEPFLNNEIIELCESSKGIGLKVNIITNGTLLHNIDLARLFDSIDGLGISLDSVDDKVNSTLWGSTSDNLLHNILQSLDKINTLAKRKKVNLTLMPVVSRLNVNSIEKLILTAQEKLEQCELNWNLTRYETFGNKEVDELLWISEDEYISSIAKSIQNTYIKNEAANILDKDKINTRINSFAFSSSGKFLPPKSPKFITCIPSFFVSNSGDVYPCQGFEKDCYSYKLGNIIESSLEELFHKEIFKDIRTKILVNNVEICSECEFRFVCTNKCIANPDINHKDINTCRKMIVQRLYLETQL